MRQHRHFESGFHSEVRTQAQNRALRGRKGLPCPKPWAPQPSPLHRCSCPTCFSGQRCSVWCTDQNQTNGLAATSALRHAQTGTHCSHLTRRAHQWAHLQLSCHQTPAGVPHERIPSSGHTSVHGDRKQQATKVALPLGEPARSRVGSLCKASGTFQACGPHVVSMPFFFLLLFK